MSMFVFLLLMVKSFYLLVLSVKLLVLFFRKFNVVEFIMLINGGWGECLLIGKLFVNGLIV